MTQTSTTQTTTPAAVVATPVQSAADYQIDVHVLLSPEREKLHAQCIASIIGQPVNLVTLPAAATITDGRLEGLSIGTAPYVAWVDDDDWVAPGVFQACLDMLAAHPEACGVYTSEAHWDGGVRLISPPVNEAWSFAAQVAKHPYVHHLTVMRRSMVEPLMSQIAAYPTVGDQLLLLLLGKEAPWVHVPMVGYYWRKYHTQASAKNDIRTQLAAVIKVAHAFTPTTQTTAAVS